MKRRRPLPKPVRAAGQLALFDHPPTHHRIHPWFIHVGRIGIAACRQRLKEAN